MDTHSLHDAPIASARALFSSDVTSYYSRKTSDILYKYGPGPRVHFHVGLFQPGAATNTTVAPRIIQRRLIDSQEAMLSHCGHAWLDEKYRSLELLDVGCGLGGGAIYWAQEHDANVTALTNVAEHIPIVSAFARQASVSERVTPLLVDVHRFQAERKYDAAVAIESSGYMDRVRLFEVMANALKPAAWFGIVEHFLCRPEWAGFIDHYYKTRLGTLTEYIEAGRAAGFTLEQDEDLTDRVCEFWMQSMAWSSMELDAIHDEKGSSIERHRLIESVMTHGKLFRIWREHALETRMLGFRLCQG